MNTYASKSKPSMNTMQLGDLFAEYTKDGAIVAREGRETLELNSRECEALRRFFADRMRDMDEERNPR